MYRSLVAITALLIGTGVVGVANADTPLSQSNVVGLPTLATPSQHAFTDSAAEALTVTLTDFQTPAAFSSLQIAVTLGNTLVGSATVDATTHTAAVPLPAAAGNYMVYVIGTPDSVQEFGSFGVCVTRDADPTPRTCVPDFSYSDNLTTPNSPSSSAASTLNTNFTTTTAGAYTVTLADDAFPVALSSVSAIITQGSTQVGGIITATTPVQVNLQAGTTYQLLAAAVADPNLQAGLYGIHIAGPDGTVVFDRSIAVGALTAATAVTNPSSQALTLTVTDFDYPAALNGAGAAVTSGGIALGTLNAPGTLPIASAPAGHIDVWTYATAGPQPGVYSVNLSGNASLLATTRVVNPPAGSGSLSFAFVVNLPSAGTYSLAVNDFEFPAQLLALSASVAQSGAVLPQGSDGTFAAQAGNAIVLASVQAPQNGNGIFGVTVATTGTSPQVLLDQTQAVGGLFDTQILNLGTSGAYNVTLADLGFPKAFQNLAVVLSSGSQVIGKIYGGGTFPATIQPGQYILTFVATPDPEGYGLYSLNIASQAPTVTFTAASSSLSAGQPVQLTWSSQNATGCTAAGASGWTGSQPTSGSLAVVLGASVTLTLTCTGPGGSAAQSLSVTVAAAPAKSSGGGGRLDLLSLLMLSALAAAGSTLRRKQRR